MAKIECYFISGSPPCWSIMLALAAKGLSYEPRRLDNSKREHKSEAFLAINPRGRVPVLTDAGITVRETNAILAYLEVAYPEPPLFGLSPAQAAAIWQIVSEAEERLRNPIGNITRQIFRGRAAEMTADITEAIQPVREELIPTCTDQNSCAHWRIPIEMIFHGLSISLFQASQQSATISS